MNDTRVFRYNESAAITSMDPAAARSLEHMWVVDQLYDGLVELTPELEVAPCLAHSWTFNDSSLTYRFKLRDDVLFDWSAIDCNGCGRVPRRARGSSSHFFWRLDFGCGCAGWDCAVNDSILDIQLNKPYPPFLGLLTTAYGSIVDSKAIVEEGASLRNQPLGSGPFQLAWWLPDAGLVMHRNERYWERDEQGNRLPYLEAIHVDVVQDMGAEFLGLTQGRYDFISGLHPAYMETLLDQEGVAGPVQGFFQTTGPFLADYLGIRLDGPSTPEALRDVRVRKAMSLALNRQGLARHLRRNAVTPTDHFVPPTMLGLEETLPVAQNLEQAAMLLADAGHPNGQGVGEIVLSTTSDYVDMCAAFQHDWARIGLDVKVDVVPASVHREKVAQGECTMFYKSWLADHADAENFLGLFVHANFAPGGPNYTHFQDDTFERLFTEALGETENRAARLSTYAQLDSIVHSDMPVIPLFHDEVTHILSDNIRGWRIHPVNRLDLRRVSKE